jgi:aryl-alcohol dehydrogenase-like predicted oxidoreductase
MTAERLVFGTYDLPDTPLIPRLLDRFVARGGRALDVANVYRDGESARATGRWLRGAGADVVVYAKGCHPPHCRPELVAAEVDVARELLGLERIDVFLLHRDDPGRPADEWAAALLEQVRAGAIGGFGVSNWTVPRVRELHAFSEQRLLAFSNHFSLAQMVSAPWPGCLASTAQELCALADLELRVIAWSSLATGFFAGRDVPCWDSPANRARRERAVALAAELATTAPAIALAYVLQQPAFVLPAFGSRSLEHIDDAFAAAELELTPDQLSWLEHGARQPA